MATSISAATFRLTITEEITLDGEDRGGKTVLEIASITKVFSQIVSVPTAANGLEILQMGSSAGPGKLVGSAVKYLRLTNKDATNYVTLYLEGNSNFLSFKLEAGKSFILGNNQADITQDVDSVTLADLTSIQGLANTAACDVEVFAVHTG